MNNKLTGLALVLVLIAITLFSCAVDNINSVSPAEEKAIDNQLNAELAQIMDIYSRAILTTDSKEAEKLVAEFEATIKEFDKKYNTNISADYEQKSMESASRSGGDSSPLTDLTDLPLDVDGAVYLSGGATSTLSKIVEYVSPGVTRGSYYHGAVLDLEKFDPTNPSSQCLQSAVPKGAGYETPSQWRRKANVAVLYPVNALNKTKLNQAQVAMDYYCKDSNTNMKYGFFKDTINIFSIVSKSDTYHWYCTKVVWKVYNDLGINLDSNTNKIDWKSSGLYSVISNYYKIRYLFNQKKAKRKMNEHITNAQNQIVVADEIYYSPNLRRVYERIRRPKY